MCRAGLESLPSSNAHIGDPWPTSVSATGREAAGLPKGSWVSGVAALGPLLLPIGAWGLGVTPKVDFPSRLRQSLPVASRQLPDMYPALAARSSPPRRPRSREFPQCASKLWSPPQNSVRFGDSVYFQKRFGSFWQIPYSISLECISGGAYRGGDLLRRAVEHRRSGNETRRAPEKRERRVEER